MHTARFLLLPGWQGLPAQHWQSLWAQRPGFTLVDQDDWWWPRRGDWMTQLEQALLADDRPAVLVANGLGCHLVTRWAGHSTQTTRVAAALLVAPPDLHRPALAPQLQAWAPALTQRLPFASTLASSDDDPWCDPAHAQQLAAGWGSLWTPLRGAGHGNSDSDSDSDSNWGVWPQGLQLLAQLCQRVSLTGRVAPATAPPGPNTHTPSAH